MRQGQRAIQYPVPQQSVNPQQSNSPDIINKWTRIKPNTLPQKSIPNTDSSAHFHYSYVFYFLPYTILELEILILLLETPPNVLDIFGVQLLYGVHTKCSMQLIGQPEKDSIN